MNEEELEFEDDLNIWEVFHNDDHVKVALELTWLTDELLNQKSSWIVNFIE